METLLILMQKLIYALPGMGALQTLANIALRLDRLASQDAFYFEYLIYALQKHLLILNCNNN